MNFHKKLHGMLCCFLLLLCRICYPVENDFPDLAYITGLAVDYAEPDIVYAATLSGGLYKSINTGDEWIRINASAGFIQYYTVVIDPQNPSRIFAGGFETGIWISNDRGEGWIPGGLDGITICHIAVNAQNPNQVYVLTPGGVCKTNDIRTGVWEYILNHIDFIHRKYGITDFSGPLNPYFSRWTKMAVNPHNPQEIYTATAYIPGYFFSSDAGKTWDHYFISGMKTNGRVDIILFHPTDPDIVFLGTHHAGVFKSFNSGKSWVSMTRGMEPQRRTPWYAVWLISGLVIDPTNPEIMYTGGDYSNWKTIDGGISWQELGNTLTCEFARSFAVDPVRPEIVYAGTNVGVFRSTDGGDTWKLRNNGFPDFELINKIQVNYNDEQFEYGIGHNHRYIFRRYLTGNNDWDYMGFLLFDMVIDSLGYDENAQRLYAYGDPGTFQSDDGGLTWDVPVIQFDPNPGPVIEVPFTGNRNDPQFWTFELEIQGDIFFIDSLAQETYQNIYLEQPHIMVQLVTPEYPLDKTKPIWQKTLYNSLDVTLQIPKSCLQLYQDCLLYVEVRDFQKLKHFGVIEINKSQLPDRVFVPVDTETLLPVFNTDFVYTPLAKSQLLQNFPNPFNKSTNLCFEIMDFGRVNISIYNCLGQKINTLVDSPAQTGIYYLPWDGVNEQGIAVSTGVYFAVMQTDNTTFTRKMILLR